MKLIKKLILIIFISINYCITASAADNLFEKAKKNLKKKIMKNRSFYFKETLYLIQKMLNLTFI